MTAPSTEHGWRVTFWFLSDKYGWIQIGFAFLDARDEQHALSRGAQRAAALGFAVNKDTKITVSAETDGRL